MELKTIIEKLEKIIESLMYKSEHRQYGTSYYWIMEESLSAFTRNIFDVLKVNIDIIWLKQIMNDICVECKEEKTAGCPYTCSILPSKVAKIINEVQPIKIKRSE